MTHSAITDETRQSRVSGQLVLILVTVFLNIMGLGLILPVMAATQIVLMFFKDNPREAPIIRRELPIPASAFTR